MNVSIEPIIGRYLNTEIDGVQYRMYYEEAGQGIPLLCLHTAGADGRQYRHLMLDKEVTRRFRVIAFDMPWHGKSYPPVGWQDKQYLLTTDAYTNLVLGMVQALDLDKPALMGCSIGGRLVLHLAAKYASSFRALIGLESAAYQQPWYDTQWLNRPDVHGGQVCAALVSGLVAPQSPSDTAHETLWQYMQGGPGVFMGDLYFYRVDSDLREEILQIDTQQCPLFLLTGEYDFSCSPEDSKQTADRIPGAEFTVMKELGHFPMSENPEQFRRYILPILDKIAQRADPSAAQTL